MTTDHTPTPWKAVLDAPTAVIKGHVIKADHGAERPVALVTSPAGSARDKANALFIVKAVNCHDELFMALKTIRDTRDFHAEHGCYPDGTLSADQEFDDWAADVASVAIAKAEGMA